MDDDGPGRLDGRIQNPLRPAVVAKEASGAQKRKGAKASPASRLAPLSDEVLEKFAALGPPPLGDPRDLTVWQQKATGIIGWAYLTMPIGPGQAIRLKGFLDSINAGAKIAVKAIDRKLQRDVARKAGVLDEGEDDGLGEIPGGAPDVGATR